VFERSAKYLLRFGYRFLSGKWHGGHSARISDFENEPSPVNGVGLIHDPYEHGIRRLKSAVLTSSGRLSRELRESALSSADIPGPLGEYVRRVQQRAWEVSDAEVESLKKHYEEDQIFEATVCAAIGAGLARLGPALEVLRVSRRTS